MLETAFFVALLNSNGIVCCGNSYYLKSKRLCLVKRYLWQQIIIKIDSKITVVVGGAPTRGLIDNTVDHCFTTFCVFTKDVSSNTNRAIV